MSNDLCTFQQKIIFNGGTKVIKSHFVFNDVFSNENNRLKLVIFSLLLKSTAKGISR